MTRIRGTLHEDLSKFMVTSRGIRLRMRKFSDEHCRKNQITFCLITFFRQTCRL